MLFHKQRLPGVWLIDAEPHSDERGVLRRHFCIREFAAHGLETRIAQGNVSENPHRHTLRGFHYQNPPFAEAKTVSCLRGAIYAVVADIRAENATYLQWIAVELNEQNRRSIHVPPGCAMAFLTLEENSLLHYYASEVFAPDSYQGIRYNDPSFGFAWPAEPKLISAKDRSYPDFLPRRS